MFRKAKNKAENAGTTDIAEMMPKTKKEKKPWDKEKKKKVRRRAIAGVLAALIAAFFVRNSLMAKNTAPMVSAVAAEQGDVEQILSTGGTVKSDETRTYFAPISVEVGEVNVSTGDTVKKGDVILTFNEKELAEKRLEAEYKLASNEGGYESSLHKDNQYIADLSEATTNLEVLDQQIADNENLLKEINKKIEDKKAGWSYNGAALQATILEQEKKIADEKQKMEERHEWEAQQGLPSDDKALRKQQREKEEKDEAAKAQIAYDEEVLLNLQEQAQYNSYEEQNNKEVRELQRQAKEVEDLIASYKEYKSEMKSQKETSENNVLDQGSREKLEADTALEKLTNQETLDAIAKVENGLKADFGGVITELEAVSGQPPTESGKLVTIESVEKVSVRLNVSKYDLESLAVGQSADVEIAGTTYEGTVAKIDGMATKNDSGAMVVGVDVTVNNPDENIFLGVEARVYIHTAKAENTVNVPIETVCSDVDGDFVFVEKDGLVAKQRVTVGISTDSVCEITEGLTAGENVLYPSVMGMGVELEEGMAVTVMGAE